MDQAKGWFNVSKSVVNVTIDGVPFPSLAEEAIGYAIV